MFNKLKQFKDLRDQAKQLQSQMAEEKVDVEGNWGKIKMTINGNMEVLSLNIDESLLTANNKESLQKEITNLFNDGIKKVQKKLAQKMVKDGKMPNLTDLLK